MTQDDLNQIRTVMREEVRDIVRAEVRDIVRAEIAANNETLSAALRKEFNDSLKIAVDSIRDEFNNRLTAAVGAIRQEFAERLRPAAVAFSTDFSELHKELGQRIGVLDRRMEALEHRMDRIAETTAGIEMNVAALTRWANRVDRENLELRNTQVAQQNAIDEMAKRLRPPTQPPT